MCYQVGETNFYNIFLAVWHAWKHDRPVKFYCFDHEFDQIDWTLEPESSLDELMTSHAHRLREQYDRLILLWSGGTDSHTIYNIFQRNEIHLDEILVCSSPQSRIVPENAHVWLRKNHWDPTTRISRYDNHDTALRAIDIKDENWVWENRPDLLKYGTIASPMAQKFLIEQYHSGTRWCAIEGYEKPRLVYKQGRWYHRQLASTFQAVMGLDFVEHFYLEPLIAVKQAHMVKRAVKKKITENRLPLYDGDWAESKWAWTKQGYREWATACGRHDEVNIGVSFDQKNANIDFDRITLDSNNQWKNIDTRHDLRLLEDIQRGNPVANNFIKGFHNLATEKGFVDFLRQERWFRHADLCFTTLKFVWSQEHDLGL